MKERIKELRKALHLTQAEFAQRIGVKQNTVAQYESGRNDPTDTVLKLICLNLGASEVWLRTGEGEMFAHKSREAEFSAACGEILRSCPDEDTLAVLTRVISALAKVDWSGVGLVQKRVDEIKKGE